MGESEQYLLAGEAARAPGASRRGLGRMRTAVFSYENTLVVILGFALALVVFDTGAVSSLSPFLVKELHLSATALGVMASATSLTGALSGFLSGRVSDLLGRRKPILIGSLIAFSLCSFLSGITSSFIALLAARLLMGLTSGPTGPLGLAIIARASSPGRRAFNTSLIQNVFISIVASLAPILLIALATGFGWRAAFYIAGIPGLIVALAAAKFIKEGDGSTASIADEPARHPPAHKLGDIIRERNIWVSALICIFIFAVLAAGGAFLPLYFVQMRHLTPIQMGLVLGMTGLAGLLGSLIVPFISDRIGRKPIVILLAFVGLTMPLASLFYHGPLPGLCALVFVGSSFVSLFPFVTVIIPCESLPANAHATALGFIGGVGQAIGSFAAPAITGYIADRTSLAAPLYVMIFCSVIAGLLGFLLKESLPARVQGVAR